MTKTYDFTKFACDVENEDGPLQLSVVHVPSRGWCVSVNGRVPGDSPAFRTREDALTEARRFYRRSLASGKAILQF